MATKKSVSVKKAASIKKGVETRALRRKEHEAYVARAAAEYERRTAALNKVEVAVGPAIWKKYLREEADVYLSGTKDFSNRGILRRILGDNYECVMEEAGLNPNSYDF